MLPILHIGPFAIQTPGLTYLAGAWLGLWVSENTTGKRRITGNQLYSLAMISIGVGILGARLVYILRYPAAFLPNPAGIVSLNPGLLDPIGGLICGLSAGGIYCHRKSIPIPVALDALTPFFAILGISANLADFASGNAFGTPSNLPWSIHLWGVQRHPTQLYGAIGGLFVLGLVLLLDRKKESPGLLFAEFLGLAAATWLFTTGFRAANLMLWGGYRPEQIISWLILCVSLVLIHQIIKKESTGLED